MRPIAGGRAWRWALSAPTLAVLMITLVASACSTASGEPRDGLPVALRDLPLLEFPSTSPSPLLALVMSGDGNWIRFLGQLGDTLVDRGVPVVGLESRAYLSRPRTPDEVAQDMTRVLRHYLDAWNAERVLIVGYSRGADFAPFLVNRMPEDLRSRVAAVGLLSPTKMASFEFHWMDLVTFTPRETDVDMIAEVDALAPLPVLCVYGTDDEHALCPLLPEGLAEVVPQSAGHRLGGPGAIADLLLERAGAASTPPVLPVSDR